MISLLLNFPIVTVKWCFILIMLVSKLISCAFPFIFWYVYINSLGFCWCCCYALVRSSLSEVLLRNMQQSNFIEIALRHWRSSVYLLHTSEHLFIRTPLHGCFWLIKNIFDYSSLLHQIIFFLSTFTWKFLIFVWLKYARNLVAYSLGNIFCATIILFNWVAVE